VIQSKLIRFYLEISRFVDKPEFCDVRMWRAAGRAVQDSRSMKPRLRNANLLITHVLDMCVKLLVVSNISTAQGLSVDLSVRITRGEGTGTRPDYLVNRDEKKFRGRSGKQIARKSRNSC